MTVDQLGRALAAFLAPQRHSIWDRLLTEAASGRDGSRHPPHSQPPVKLSVVSLVIDVTDAARETVDELARRRTSNTPGNLWLIHDVLARTPNPDMITWWTEAVQGWTARAETILAPNLMRWLYGARCPYCRQVSASAQLDGEVVRLPAIGVTWDEPDHDVFQVQAVECRACGAQWARDANLSDLVSTMLAVNATFETLGIVP